MPVILIKALLCETFGYKFSELATEPADEILQGWQVLNLYHSHIPKTPFG
jgi:hypothetical protein